MDKNFRNEVQRIVNRDYDSWPLEVKQQVACKTQFTLDIHSIDRLLKLADRDDYTLRYKQVKVAMVPEELENELQHGFSIFSADATKYMFVVTEPNDIVLPHHDPVRTAALYIPLTPIDADYAPMEFYYKNNIYAIDNTDRYRMWIVNVNNLHAVFNNEHERFNLQCSFMREPYAKIFKKYEQYLEF